MANDEIILRIKTMMDSGDVKGAVSQMQSYFDKLKPSDQVRGDFDKLFKDLIKEADQFETRVQGSFDKIGDVNSLKKVGNNISTIFSKITKEFNKISGVDTDLSQFFNIDTSKMTQITKQIDQLKNKLTSVTATKIDDVEQSFNELLKTSKRAQGSNFFESFKSSNLDQASADFEQLSRHLTGFGTKSDAAKQAIRTFLSLLNGGEISAAKANITKLMQFGGAAGSDSKLIKYANALVDIAEKLQEAKQESGEFVNKIEQLNAQKVEVVANAMREATNNTSQFKNVLNTAEQGFDRLKTSANSAASSVQSFQSEVQELGSRATYFLSLENSVDLFRRGVQQAIETVKELDAAMAETAVVTDFTIGDMWDKLPEYSQMARELGVEIKGVYEASTLYYQQGLQTEQVMALTTETLKMARIAGLECADATNLMTAALRGFNMEINEQSAQRINDVYSELAAITAADTNEIATAMTKTASIANSANMELETTSALLAQMIETTREPAETAGTAMKTIIARFTEMKKAVSDTVSVEGEDVSVNKVDAALASVGVQLKDVNGEFRDLDDVLLELASKWNSLDIMSQRYIATTAAGSRQQSRFIAMMQDYERTMELVDAAYNSSGSSAQQFDKTQESLQSTLARLSVAWDTFLMGIADDSVIKGFITAITKILEAFNKITEGADGLIGSVIRIGTVFGGLRIANDAIKTLISSFVTLKGSIADGTAKLTGFQSLSQRLSNGFRGKGFVTNATAKANADRIAAESVNNNIASAKAVGANRAEQKVINKINRRTAHKEQLTQSKTKAQAIVNNPSNYSSGQVEEAKKKIQNIDTELGRLNSTPINLKMNTAEAKAKVEALENQLKADPANKKLEIDLLEAQGELEAFEQMEEMDDIEKRVTIDRTSTILPLGSPEVGQQIKDGISPDEIGITKGFKKGLKDNKPTNWFKGESSSFNKSMDSMKTKTKDFFGMFKKGSGGATKMAGKLGGAIAKAGGIAAKGFGAVGGVLTGLGPIGVAVAVTLVAAASSIYAAWYYSSGQIAKRMAESDQMMAQNSQKTVDFIKTKINEIDDAWTNISSAQVALDGMTQGTYEWTKQVQSLKQEIQDLVNLYPELYKYVTIDSETGAWTMSTQEMQSYLIQAEQDLDEQENRAAFRTMIADSSTSRSEELKKHEGAGDDTQFRNIYQSYFGALVKAKEEEEDDRTNDVGALGSYRAKFAEVEEELQLQKLFPDIKSSGEKEIDTEEEGRLAMEIAADTDDFLSAETRQWIKDHGKPRQRNALQLYEAIEKENQAAQDQYAAIVSSNLSGKGYDEKVINAVVQSAAYGEDSVINEIRRSRLKRGYDGGSSGEGMTMEESREFLESEGFIKVSQTNQHYYNPETKEAYNLDENFAPNKTKTIKYNGEEITAQSISDETVRDWKETQDIYDRSLKAQNETATAINNNPELLKLVSGDLDTNLSQFFDQGTQTWKKLESETLKELEYATGEETDKKKVLLDYKTYGDNIKKEAVSFAEELGTIYQELSVNFASEAAFYENYRKITGDQLAAMQDIKDFREQLGVYESTSFGTKLEGAYSLISDNRDKLYSSKQLQDSEKTLSNYKKLGIEAEDFKKVVEQIGQDNSAINNAKILNKLIKEGGELSEEAKVIWDELGGEEQFGFANQIKELASSEAWTDIQSELTSLYVKTGQIGSENIRELAKENINLSSIMKTTGMRASAMAELMEDVEAGELSLMDVTEEVANSYKVLYNSIDLAGDALARIKEIEIGDTDTEIGKIYTENWKAVQDLMERGAYGDSQIDDYMAQLIGTEAWEDQLTQSHGNKYTAFQSIDDQYGLSKNTGNMYGSFSYLLRKIGPVEQKGNTIISLDSNGILNYDLSKFEGNSEELIELVQDELNVTKEYAETLIADMKTYSKTLSSDLQQLDAKESFTDLIKSRTDSAGKVNITDLELEKFADAFNVEVEKLKKSVKINSKTLKESQVDRTYSKNKTFYADNTKDDTVSVGFVNESQLKELQEALTDDIENYKTINNKTTDENTYTETKQEEELTRAKEKILDNDVVLEIVASAEFSNAEKTELLKQLGLTEPLIQDLLDDTELIDTKAKISEMAKEFELGLQAAVDTLKGHEVEIPVGFRLTVKLGRGNALTDFLGITGQEFTLNSSGTENHIKIGGENTKSTPTGSSNSGGSGDNTDVDLQDLEVSGGGGSGTGGQGSAYNQKHDEDNTGKDGGGGGGSEEENDTNPKVENLDKKLEALDRKLERREINAVEHKFAQDELYLEKKMALEAQKRAEEAQAKYIGKYYKYDAETDAYLYLENAYNNASDETKNKIDEEIEKLQGINDELNEIEDAIEDFEFKNPADEQRFYEAEGNKMNAETDLAHIERKRAERERYGELVGKLPSEIQGPLNMGLLGMDMMYEAEEIQVNQGLKTYLEDQMRSKYNDSDYAGEYYTWDERTQSFKINEEALSDTRLDDDVRTDILEEFNEIQDLAKAWKDVSDELSGGFIQDAFKEAGEAAEDLAISFINDGHAADNINDIFNRFEKKLGLNEKALDGFGNAIGDAIDSSELLDKTFKGFGIENIEEKINKSPIGGLLSGNQKALLSMIGGEGGTIGELGSSIGLNISEALGGFGDLLNFDMMSLGLDMFNGFQDMIDQGKQMIEKIVGYITQATQVIVDAWTNREDYLYNFLQIIEKHLNEYEKLQRYQNQLEKGRTSTVDEIRANYDKQWKSLQQQLEEQQERLETRQKELERSRWSPFSLISGWNPSSDALYENREVKFLWDIIIGFGEAFAPFGTGAFFSQLNQLYEDYDQRVQNSYEDRLAAEQALLDIEDERLELVKYGSDEATEFEQKVLDAMIKKEQEQIDELTRLNDAITDANSKLISTLQDNLDKMRQDRENEKKEEELGEKERRLAYLRQDTSGANMMEIKKLEEELEEEHEDYTDTLIDQKISELEKQNELAAEQRQQQIDLLQSQLEYAEKYGLYWDAIYGMLYTIDENGNAVLNPENFDLDGNIRENSQLAQMLGTFSDRLGMSVWSAVLDNEEMKRLGRYYGFFIGNNGVTGNWRHQWALDNPGADDPNFAYPDQEIPEGLWGVLYRLEIGIKKYFANSDPDLIDRGGRIGQAFKNFFGKLFGNEEWANYQYEAVNAAHVQSTTFAGMKKLSDDTKEWFKSLFSNNESYGNKTSRNLTGNGAQNIGDINTTNYFQIGNVGETISLDEMVDRVAERFRDMFSIGNNVLGRSRT